MTTHAELAALVLKIPEDKVQQAYKQLEPLAKKPVEPRRPEEQIVEPVEFVIRDVPSRKIRLPILVRAVGPRKRIAMEIGEKSEKHAAAIRSLIANARWWQEHRREIVAQYRDCHIAVSQGEVFRGDSYVEALTKSRAKFPDDLPFVIRLHDIGAGATNAN